MVLESRSDDRNSRRLRGNSPNDNGLSDDGSTSDSDRDDGGMRVGDEFQAKVPPFVKTSGVDFSSLPDKALLIWKPTIELSENKMDEFTQLAKEKFNYNSEQALGMLFWHKHDAEKALADLVNFTPFPDEWSVEDKVLFEQAFQFHGKSFHRIRQMLPEKSIANLIKYYYSWKKTRSRTSLMDKQARRLATARGDEVMSDGVMSDGSSDSDMETDKDDKATGVPAGEKSNCANCAANAQLHSTIKGNFCNSCYQYFRRTGTLRPTLGPIRKNEGKEGNRFSAQFRQGKKKPPKGMHLVYDDLISIATGPPTQGDAILRQMDGEIVTLKRQVQNNKQLISALKHKTHEALDPIRSNDFTFQISQKWTNEELLLAVQGLRKYGKDFKAMAEAIGTKTEAHLRCFYVNYRRRYNLDQVLQEYEQEFGPVGPDITDEKTEEDLKEAMTSSETDFCQGIYPPAITAKMTLISSMKKSESAAPITHGAAIVHSATGGQTPAVVPPPPLLKSTPTGVTGAPAIAPARTSSLLLNKPPPPLIRPATTTPLSTVANSKMSIARVTSTAPSTQTTK